jgi:hypothetical protein
VSADLDPNRNRPVIATLVTAFLTALVTWGVDSIPDSWPTEVKSTGYALAVALIAIVAGKVAQQVGKHAPWAADTHAAAVAYALTLNPDEHSIYAKEANRQLQAVGIDDMAQAREIIGLEP